MRENWLGRLIGLIIAVVVIAAAGLLWFGFAVEQDRGDSRIEEGLVLGFWDIFYDTEIPSVRVMSIAAGLALLSAAFVALLERRASNRSRRSENRG